ncbi:MAG TPA: ABC transporter ATP-binding protein [Anaerolineales bacterium]|nr:ABC transporter ATP-binding protein [Anaerolineales bacterium]
MSDHSVVIETHNLTKVYGDGAGVRALDGVNLTVHVGEFVSIVGPSGSGKSTLLNLLGALDRPTSGEVIINGAPLARVRDLDHFRSQTVGFVFQTHNLIPTLTARENVEVPMYESGWSGKKRRTRAEELLQLVGLGARLNFLPNQLSGGERQRVAVARALVNHPAIILADEPTGNLDSKTTAEIMRLLSDLNHSPGTTLIVVTHNHEVARATRRIVTLRDGKIEHDLAVSSAFEGDLIDLKNSRLGQAILHNNAELPEDLRDFAPQLKTLLERV